MGCEITNTCGIISTSSKKGTRSTLAQSYDLCPQKRYGVSNSHKWKKKPDHRYLQVVFPLLQWTRVCLSLDSHNSKVILVVDGEQLGEQNMTISKKPNDLNIEVGRWGGDDSSQDQPGMVTDLNVFSSVVPVEDMISYTKAGDKRCGSQGDFLSWDHTLKPPMWKLNSGARIFDLVKKHGRPCWRQPSIQVFRFMEPHWQHECMDHCRKLGG